MLSFALFRLTPPSRPNKVELDVRPPFVRPQNKNVSSISMTLRM